MLNRRQSHHRAAIPNLAPMVDVTMVILIFFMLGTSFAASEGVFSTQLPTQLGPGGESAVSIIPQIRIALVQEPGETGSRILVLGQALSVNSFEALAALLREKREAGTDPSGRILLSADPGVEYRDVVAAMDACLEAGMPNIQLGVGASAVGVSSAP